MPLRAPYPASKSLGITATGIPDVLLRAASQVHGERQRMCNFLRGQAHGDGCGGGAGQCAGLTLVVEPAFALPRRRRRNAPCPSRRSRPQRRDDLPSAELEFFAQRQRDRH